MKVIIVGAGGRMGQTLVRQVSDTDGIRGGAHPAKTTMAAAAVCSFMEGLRMRSKSNLARKW